MGLCVFFRHCSIYSKDQNEADLEEIAVQAYKQFSFETLSKATNNFHPDQKLGEGGFGPVFKVKLDLKIEP